MKKKDCLYKKKIKKKKIIKGGWGAHTSGHKADDQGINYHHKITSTAIKNIENVL